MNKDDIKYLALVELGYNTKPDFVNSDDNVARLINDQYEFVMSLALSSYNWSFASKKAQLTQSNNTNSTKYRFQYQLPEDAIFVRGVYDDSQYRSIIADYEMYTSHIFTDSNACYIEYTKRVIEDSLPAWFVDYLKNLLARKVCKNATGDNDLLQLLSINEQQSYADAKNADMKQRAVQIMPNGSFITIRG